MVCCGIGASAKLDIGQCLAIAEEDFTTLAENASFDVPG